MDGLDRAAAYLFTTLAASFVGWEAGTYLGGPCNGGECDTLFLSGALGAAVAVATCFIGIAVCEWFAVGRDK